MPAPPNTFQTEREQTHTLAALYHLATSGGDAGGYPGVADLLRAAGVSAVPEARVAVFVGNAWDPWGGRETPWLDLTRRRGRGSTARWATGWGRSRGW